MYILTVINQIKKHEETFMYETLKYYIRGVCDIKIHEQGIDIFEKGSLLDNSHADRKEFFHARHSIYNIYISRFHIFKTLAAVTAQAR